MPGLAEPVLSVAAGALTTLSPCVFPLLPVIVGGAVQRHRAAPVAMGLGMAMGYKRGDRPAAVVGDDAKWSDDED